MLNFVIVKLHPVIVNFL